MFFRQLCATLFLIHCVFDNVIHWRAVQRNIQFVLRVYFLILIYSFLYFPMFS